MAMTSTLTQSQNAMMGTPTTFVLAVKNGGGSQVSVNSIQPVVKNPDGSRSSACNIGPVTVTPELGSAQVGGSQFNVPIAGSATTYFSFQVVFFGSAVPGGFDQAPMAFVVDAITSYSDNSTSGVLAPIQLNLNAPQFGQAPGIPPNSPGVAGNAQGSSFGIQPPVGQLAFQVPANGVLAL